VGRIGRRPLAARAASSWRSRWATSTRPRPCPRWRKAGPPAGHRQLDADGDPQLGDEERRPAAGGAGGRGGRRQAGDADPPGGAGRHQRQRRRPGPGAGAGGRRRQGAYAFARSPYSTDWARGLAAGGRPLAGLWEEAAGRAGAGGAKAAALFDRAAETAQRREAAGGPAGGGGGSCSAAGRSRRWPKSAPAPCLSPRSTAGGCSWPTCGRLSGHPRPEVAGLLLEAWPSAGPTLRRELTEALFARKERLAALVTALERRSACWPRRWSRCGWRSCASTPTGPCARGR